MEKVFGLYNHEDFGSLRTLVTDDDFLFCADDVAEALDFPDPRGAVKKYCKHIEMYGCRVDGGTQVTGFTDIDDVMRLVGCSKSENVDSFKDWLFGEVVPGILRDAGIDATEDDDDAEYIIRMGDYMARIYLEAALYETLNCLVHGIRNLPDEGIDAHALKMFAEKSAELVNGAVFSSGITKEFLSDGNPDHLSELLEETLLTPEDAGYAAPCYGERCCDYAERLEQGYEDEDFEYDEYDEDEDCVPETGEISAILDCCKRLLTVADSQLNRLAAE